MIGVLFAVSGAFTGASTATVFVTRRHHQAPAAARSHVSTLAAGITMSAAPIVAGALGCLRIRGTGSTAARSQ